MTKFNASAVLVPKPISERAKHAGILNNGDLIDLNHLLYQSRISEDNLSTYISILSLYDFRHSKKLIEALLASFETFDWDARLEVLSKTSSSDDADCARSIRSHVERNSYELDLSDETVSSDIADFVTGSSNDMYGVQDNKTTFYVPEIFCITDNTVFGIQYKGVTANFDDQSAVEWEALVTILSELSKYFDTKQLAATELYKLYVSMSLTLTSQTN